MTGALEIEGTWEEIAARAVEFEGRRLRLTVLGPSTAAPLSLADRRRFLRLPRAERARILAEQADRLAPRYEQHADWRDVLEGDIVEYQQPGDSQTR